MQPAGLLDRLRDPGERTLGVLLLAPAFVLLALIVVYPIGRLVWNSFFDLRLSGGHAARFVDYQPGIDTGHGRFAGGVNRCDNRAIEFGEDRRELAKEEFCAAVQVRLKDGDDAPGFNPSHGLKSTGNLGRVVRVIFDDGNAVVFAANLQAALHAVVQL